MTTRLDRLLQLLQNGSTPIVRATAAKQLGAIAAQRIGRGSTHSSAGASSLRHQLQKPDSAAKKLDFAPPDPADTYHGLDGEWTEIINLLVRILPYLRDRATETRLAAALAIEHVLLAAGVWFPPRHAVNDGASDEAKPAVHGARLQDLDIVNLLMKEATLLASSGTEYAKVEGMSKTASADLVQSLGLSMPGVGDANIGLDFEKELASASQGDAYINGQSSNAVERPQIKVDTSTLPAMHNAANGSGDSMPSALPSGATPLTATSALSKREQAALKRKRKLESSAKSAGPAGSSPLVPASASSNKVRVVDAASPSANGSAATPRPTSVKVEGDGDVKPAVGGRIGDSVTVAYKGPKEGSEQPAEEVTWMPQPEQWPFDIVVKTLQRDLLDAAWEIRHGAALGLREFVKIQGSSGGMVAGSEQSSNTSSHEAWTEDVACQLLIVFARDRFGDFLGDHVVAPVRETAAQCLAALVHHASDIIVASIEDELSQMVSQKEVINLRSQTIPKGRQAYFWEARHAALSGLRYIYAGRSRLHDIEAKLEDAGIDASMKLENASLTARSRVRQAYETCLVGMRDVDDDVRGCAAAALRPLAAVVVASLAYTELDGLSDLLHSSLADQHDDLASSVANILDLLGTLLGVDRFYAHLAKDGARRLRALVQSLTAYSRHTLESVRRSVVGMFISLLAREGTAALPQWVDQDTLRLLYENIVLERQPGIRDDSVSAMIGLLNRLTDSASQQALTKIALPLLPTWLHILMTPPGQPLPRDAFLQAHRQSGGHDVDKAMMAQDLSLVPIEETLTCRLAACQILSAMLALWPAASHSAQLSPMILPYLTSNWGHQISFACILVQDWSRTAATRFGISLIEQSPFFQHIAAKVDRTLQAPSPASYAEVGNLVSNIHQQSQQLLVAFNAKGKVPKAKVPDLASISPDAFSLELASRVVTSDFDALFALMSEASRKAALPILNDARTSLQSKIAHASSRKEALDVQVFAALAGVAIELQTIPAKLNPLIRSLMSAIKFESNSQLQKRAGQSVAAFAKLCIAPDSIVKSNPIDKIVKNLCTFLCQDPEITPLFSKCGSMVKGIMPGPAANKEQQDLTAVVSGTQLAQRGSVLAIESIFELLGGTTFTQLPKLWNCCAGPLLALPAAISTDSPAVTDADGQDILDSLTVLAAIARVLPKFIHNDLGDVVARVTTLVQHRLSVIRHLASRCIGELCACLPHLVMPAVVAHLVPALADPLALHRRQGAVEAIAHIVEAMGLDILPYIVFLMVPVMARNTDTNAEVRSLAVRTFAQLVKIAPLETDLPDPEDFPEELLQQRDEERRFMAQLLDGSKVSPYEMSVPVSVELRKYQREGVAWLAFLARYHLHGILCDDMGLGKTLQSICILANMTRDRAQLHANTRSPDTVHLPSLVVCPPTLTGHWLHEVHTYVSDLRAVLYVGDRASRIRTISSFSKYDVVITSYDVIRNDIDLLRDVRWHYCILDEGHIIKNAKTKLTQAVKQLQAVHRLILSGTPIQNNVLELWSLFDFLMPGFLGTEEDFSKRFSKPIQQSRNAKSSSKEQERGTLALDALHKQVLPFLLRRLKEDVLDDLPPKIIQDYYCSLSTLQLSLYDRASVTASAGADSGDATSPHAFHTLQYLRKLVNHPLLVLDQSKPQDAMTLLELGYSSITDPKLRRLEEAPKLLALQQLLLDNGVGVLVKKEEEDFGGPAAGHRFLIFCQLKTMLDLIEQDLFKMHMPDLTYMRLDGSTPASQRHALVQKFNGDPTIDVLLLTTHVGGLGLNLTGADTVVFVEHDWNPMKDLQAMDRAHRLGQTKTVNVYRLITQGTLEEKIMGLQKFKLNIAGSVVNQQNADMATMDTQNVVDLFKIGDEATSSDRKDQDKPMTQKQLLASLAEMDEGDADYSNLL